MGRTCPICGENKKDIVKKVKLNIPDKYKLCSEYNVVACNKCGFCFSDTESTKDDFDYYYKNFNFYLDTEESESLSVRNQLIINVMKQYLNEESFLLNIGIGNGNFEKELRKQRFNNIYGIDPDKKTVNQLKLKGFEAKQNSIYDEIPKDLVNKFDAVFLLDTLEHLYDLEKAIINLKQYVREDGYIIISVPDIGIIHNDTTKIPNNFNHEHINYFSRISLINLFAKFGLTEVELHSINYKHGKNNENGIVSVFKKEKNIEKKIIKDIVTKNAIKLYLELQENLKPNEIINKYIDSQEEIVIWGTGAYVMDLLANNNLNKCNIAHYVDNNSTRYNKQFNGKLIKAPNREELNGKTIFICAIRHYEDIKKQIDNMNINCNIEII